MSTRIKAKRFTENRIALTALLVSTFAVVLSQFRPLYTYLDHPKLEVNPTTTTQVYHGWGNIGIIQFIQFRNSGSATGKITRAEIYLERKDDPTYRRRLPAQSYYLKPTSITAGQVVTQIPFAHISLAPGELWDSFINFYFPFTREKEAQISDFTNSVQQQIQDKITESPSWDKAIKTIDDQLFDEISHFTKINLSGFRVGEYYLLTMFWDDESEKPQIVKCFSFSVFEAEIKRLDLITEQYKIGAGVYFTQTTQIGFQTTLYEVQNQSIIEKLLRNFQSL